LHDYAGFSLLSNPQETYSDARYQEDVARQVVRVAVESFEDLVAP
jgi:hypothetical protein